MWGDVIASLLTIFLRSFFGTGAEKTQEELAELEAKTKAELGQDRPDPEFWRNNGR